MWNFAHCVYILASSSCLYIINKVSTESRLLISAFYYIITWCKLRKNSWRSVEQSFVLPSRFALIGGPISVWRHVKTINMQEYTLSRAPTPSGAPSQLLKKKKKKRDTPFSHQRPRPLAPHVCGWMQMIIIDGQLCPWKDINSPAPRKKLKRWKRSPHITFRWATFIIKEVLR